MLFWKTTENNVPPFLIQNLSPHVLWVYAKYHGPQRTTKLSATSREIKNDGLLFLKLRFVYHVKQMTVTLQKWNKKNQNPVK